MNLSGDNQKTILMALKKHYNGLDRGQLAEETNISNTTSLGKGLRFLIDSDYVEYRNGSYRLTELGREYTALWVTP